MLSSLCYKGLVTPIGSELEYSTSTSTTSRRSSSDFVPLVVPRKPVRRRRRKSLLPQVEALEHQSYGLKFLSHLEKLVAGPPTSSGFNFRRLPELAVAGGDDDDSRTVVTYISLGASTPRQQRRSDHAIPDVAGIVTRSSVDCIRKPKSLKKRHVSWKDLEPNHSEEKITYRHSLYLPPMEPHAPEVTNRRHSYTSAEEDKVQQSPAIRQHTIASADLDEKKARYKLQLQRRRRYNNWFFTLYEFDKPANPEDSFRLDSGLFETIIARLHGLYALSLNSVFDPTHASSSPQKPTRLCFERLRGLSPASEDRRRLDRLFAYSRLNSDSASSTSSVSCISFGMFDSVSPHNPGQLFCPEGMPVSRAVGYSPSFYCYGCGRNMTTGSSLSSVAGSPPESLVGSRQRPKVCYSFTRSVEFYRSTRATRRAYVCPGVRRSLSYQSHATETRRRQSSSPITHRPMLTAEPVCRASKVLRRQSVKPRCRRRRQRRTTEAVSTSAAASRMPFWSSTPMPLSSSDALQTGRSDREKRFRRIFHKRLGQQRVADWLQTSQNFQSNALLSVF